MTKKEEREQARELRRQGMSINKIAKTLGISLSSASTWCRDIPLTEEQEEALRWNNERREAQVKGAKANVDIHREKRRGYQADGRKKAQESDPLHLAGCMLYWAEGAKDRSRLGFANSDPDMVITFMHFLLDSLHVPKHKIKISIHCYVNNGISQQMIENFWLNALNLSHEQMHKTQLTQPKSSQQKGRKLLYGVCTIYVGGVRYTQHIYGAIQEYIGIDKPEWLDC